MAPEQSPPLGSIELSVDADTATVGDAIQISVTFKDFESYPTYVDVYENESSNPIKTGVVDVYNVGQISRKIELDTSYLEARTYNLYVKSGNISSNSIEITLKENPLAAPKNVKVEDSGKKNTVKVTWTYDSTKDPSKPYAWMIYYNYYSDDSMSARREYADLVQSKQGKSESESEYEITLSRNDTYYFWVKAADGIFDTSNTSGFSEESESAKYKIPYSN